MQPTGTQINYYHLCHRKLWLFSSSIQMEQQSELVQEGKIIHETSYAQRASKFTELDLGFIKIDFYDAKNHVIHEVKKSKKCSPAHIAQVKYYLWVLRDCGVEATAVLEYPKLRKRQEVFLSEKDCEEIPLWIATIEKIISSLSCPPTINKPICKNCSYCEFCYT